MKRILAVFAFLMLAGTWMGARATHISGGEITFECQGNDVYLVTLQMFRDCSGNLGGPASATLTFANSCATNFTSVATLQNVGGTEISQLCPDSLGSSTCNGGPWPGMELYTYQATVTLVPACDPWTVSYTLCCRNSSVNVNGQPQMTIFSEIYNQADTCNSSPIFTSQPIPYSCASQPVNYSYGATDPDGDSLVYSLVSATSNNTTTNVGYAGGFSAAVPIPGITLNQSGELSFTTSTAGNYIVVAQVDEYDPGTGAQLSSIRRDIQFVVESGCSNNVPNSPTGYTGFSGTATATSSTEVTADVGENFCIDITFTDPNLGDNLTLTSNATTILPGATFSTTTGNPAVATICWTATTGVSTNNAISVFADDGACPVYGTNSFSVDIIVPASPPLAATVTPTDVSCNAAADGTATAQITSDTTGNTYTYAWSSGTTTFGGSTSTVTGLSPGTYSLFIFENPTGETLLVSPIVITEPSGIFLLSDTITGVSCHDDCTGALEANAVGGTSPLTYAWGDPSNQTGTNATNLCPGVYTLTITDANGCTLTKQYTIPNPPQVVAVIDSSNNVSCNGGTDGEAFASAYGGSTVSSSTMNYRIDQTGDFEPYDGVGTPMDVDIGSTLDEALDQNVPIGFNFEFFGTSYSTLTISSNGFVSFDANPGTGCCVGQTLPSGAANPNNLIAVAWNDLDPSLGGSIQYWTGGVAPNQIFVLDIDNVQHDGGGNPVTAQMVLHEGSNIIEIHTTSAPTQGGGAANHTMGIENASGTTAFVVSGRNGVDWGTISNDYVAFVPEQNLTYTWPTGASTASVTGLSAGTYCVTVSDVNGCTDTACVIINEPAAIAITATTTNASCNGVCDGTATASATGGTTPYTFDWSNGASGSNLTALCAGTYTVTLTDANGCTSTSTVAVTEPSAIGITFTTTNVSCNGTCDGTASSTVTGGTAPYTYAWPSGGTGTAETGLCAGTFTLTVTDANGCTGTAAATITEPAALVASITSQNNVSCVGGNDGSATAAGSGGTSPYTFAWPSGNTAAGETGLIAGTYCVTVTDNNGCTDTACVIITEPSNGVDASIASSTNVTCQGGNDGAATAAATGGTSPYTFSWPSGGTNANETGLTAGTYCVTVTDNNGCTDTACVIITEPSNSVTVGIVSVTNVSCNGGNDGGAVAGATLGTSPYTFAWSTGANTSTVTGLTSGSYTVTVTDASGCTDDTTIVITEPNALTATIVASTNVNCAGDADGTATAAGNGGTSPYTFAWSSGGTAAVETGLAAGTYTVTVTDNNGCTATTTTTITEPIALSAGAAVVTNVLCFGDATGQALAGATGGTTPYTFAWSTGASSAAISGLIAGTYTVTVTDNNNCTSTDQVTITEPASALDASIASQTNVTCNGGSDGTATASASGGTFPYTYSWSTGGTAALETNLPAGTYCVMVTDNNGCTDTACVIIQEPSTGVTASILTSTDPTCNGATDGSATAAGSGPSAPFTFAWNTGATSSTITGLAAGTYSVTVTNSVGCTDSASVTLTNPTTVNASITTSTNVSCNGGNDGSATAAGSGGTTPYTFAWSSGGSSAAETGLTAGTYTVTVTDNNGCTASTTVTITEPTALIASITSTNIACFGSTDGTATASGAGGTSPYTFGWSTGASTAAITGLAAGTYTVTVTDNNGCTDTDQVTITQPGSGVDASIAASTDVTCNGGNDGTATATATGGTFPYTYAWPSGGTAALETNLAAGTYCVTVTDNNGCSDTACVTITEPGTAVTAAILTSTDPSCNGATDGTATAAGSGPSAPFTFTWSTGATSASITGLASGTYSVTVTNAVGCTDSTSVTLTDPASVVASIASSTNASCNGATDGTATAAGTGGTTPYTFAWPSGGTNATESNLGAGTYCVTVTDNNGCSDTACVVITEPAGLNVIVATLPASCATTCDGFASATVSGGTTPYTLTWPVGSPLTICAGSYTMTVTDANGCTQTAGYTITAPAPIVTSMGTPTNPLCNGVCDGEVTVSVTSGGTAPFTFNWANGVTTSGANSSTNSALCDGQTMVTVTDANGCTALDSVTVTEPAALNISIATVDATCSGICDGQANATITGGTTPYALFWPGGSNVNLCAGTYVLTVTDFNGCSDTASYVINEPTTIQLTTSAADASCNGVCDGTVAASVASGGTAPFTYTWSNGASTSSQTNLCAGTYTVTVSDANGCSQVTALTINDPAALVAAITLDNAVSCNGGNDGQVTASATGGSAPLTFAWNTGDTTATLGGLGAGTYSVTITDDNGCTDSTSITLTSPNAVVAQTSVVYDESFTNGQTYCPGSSNYDNWVNFRADLDPVNVTYQSVTMSGSELPGGITCADATIATQIATALKNGTQQTFTCGGVIWTVGTACVTGCGVAGEDIELNANNSGTDCSCGSGPSMRPCIGNTNWGGLGTVTCGGPTQNMRVEFFVAGNPVTCFGGNDGAAGVTAVGGTAPYTYLWSNGDTNAIANGVTAGTYVVTVTDANGCTDTASSTVTQPDSIAITFANTDVSCNGVCDGTVTTTVTGGTAPYTYLWSNTSTSQDLTGLCAGTYTLTLTDANGCTNTATATITEPALIAISITGTTDASCNGVCDGNATATVSSGGTGPFTYTWNNGVNGQTNTTLCAGTNTVTVTDANGCTATETVTITEPSPIALTTQTLDPLCAGSCTGTALVTATGGTPLYTYLWSSGATTALDTGLCAGTHTVTVTDANGCTSTTSVTIVDPPGMTAAAANNNNASCNGVCDGSATATVSNGITPYTFLWPSGETTATATALCAGLNTVTITDSAGCTVTADVTITEPGAIVVTATSTATSCNGVCDGTASASATGGVAPLTYNWSNGASTQNLTALCAGTYTVTVTDGNGCTGTGSTTVTEPSLIVMNFSNVTTAQCNGTCNGSATVSVASGGTAPFTFNWATGTTGTVANNLCAGFNAVTVTDANGCTGVDSVLIIDPNAAVITMITSDASCNGTCDGAALAIVFGGQLPYTYTWPSGTSGVPVDTLLCAGTYNLTVTDANGCISVEPFTILEPAPIVTNISNVGSISCGVTCDGSATIGVTSGGVSPFTFTWSNGVSSNTNTTMCAGMNFVTVTDADGCTAVDSVNITAPGALSLTTTGTDASCNGVCDGTVTATVTGGTTPYTYLWSNGATIPNLTGVCAGTYTITLTDANGCSLTSSFTVNEPPLLIASAVVDNNVSCNGLSDGQATASASGGTAPYTYNWSGGQSTTTITNQPAGTYTIFVTDANGCIDSASVTITEPGLLQLSMTNNNNVSCNGLTDGSATANASGGTTPYTYTWSNGTLTATDNNLGAGTYTVTLTDANGCTDVDSVTITEPSPIVIAFSNVGAASCGGICDGTAIASVTSGGTAPFTYAWPNGVTIDTNTTLCAGTNVVTVTDANGCTATDTVIITGPNALTLVVTGTDPSCPGLCDGTASAATTGGTAPYTYLWNTGDTTTTLNGLCAGTYTVTMTDNAGCFIVDSAVLVDPAQIIVNFSNISGANCNGTCDGAATAGVTSGGTAPYTYLWSTGTTTQTDNALCAGTHTVTVTDANGCTGVDSVTIIQPGSFTITVNNVVDASCFGVCDGSIDLSVAGGTLPYTYNWSNGATTATINSLCAGTYSLTVTDGAGCQDTLSLQITEPGAIVTAFSNVVDASCNGICDGSADITVTSGGSAPFTFAWSNGTVGPNGTGLCGGMNIVTVTDGNGCTAIDTVMIVEPAPLTAGVTGTDMSCGGTCDGTASATPTGGTAPYTYLWNTGSTNSSLNSLCAGTYDVTVTDANGCTATGSYTVNSPTPIVANPSTNPATCGACDGDASVAPTGGNGPYNYLWSNTDTTSTTANLCAGVYTVTITDASGCTVVDTVTVNNDVPNLVVTDSVVDVTCFGLADGSATVFVSGTTNPPYTYLWNDPSAQITQTAVGLTAGNYIVQLTDALGCIVFHNVTVNQPDTLVVVVSGTNPSCPGDCDGTVGIASLTGGTAPYTYTWSTFATTPYDSNLCAGLYGLLVEDANGCIAADSITIIDPPALTATATVSTAISCAGSCDGEATVTAVGGTPPYTGFQWDDPAAQTTQTAVGLCAGTYNVTVTDSTGCTTTTQVIVTDPPGMTLTTAVLNPISCNGLCDGSVQVTVLGGTPGYTYLWSNGDASDTAQALCAGTYTVTVTDNNGCTMMDSITITEPAAITLDTVSVSPSACGLCTGEITVVPTGGSAPYTYDWGNGQTASTATGLCAAVYNLTVTDLNGCTSVFPIPLSDTGSAVIAVTTTDAGCNGVCDGTASVAVTTGTAPFTYLWSTGDTTNNISGLCAGNYAVTVTDSNGCLSVDTAIVNQPAPFTIAFTTTPMGCNGSCTATATANLSGGTTPFTYLWSNGDTTQTISNLCAGTYSVTVTEANGCTAVDSVTIVLPAVFNVSLTSSNISCGGSNDGSASVTASGGVAPYNYLWSNSDTTASISGLAAGTYTVIVSDAGGCSDTLTAIITEPTPITATSAVSASNCGQSNGVATVNPNGGTPFTVGNPYLYQWDDPAAQTNQTAAGLAAAIYNVTVTDSTGCTEVVQVIVNDSGAADITVDTLTPISCPGDCDGAIDLTVTGGTPTYLFNWGGPGAFSATTEDVNALCAGTYTVTVTDQANCLSFEIINLPDPQPLVLANFDVQSPGCGGTATGSITAGMTGGTQPYTYSWSSGPSGPDSTLSGLVAGTYTVTVTDNNGCTLIDSATVVEPIPMVLTVDNIDNSTCSNSNDGGADITVTGGTQPYTFLWAGVGSTVTTEDLSNVLPGTYFVTVTDSFGCQVTDSVVIQPGIQITASASGDTTLCSGSASVVLTGTATSTDPNLTFQWIDTAGTVLSTTNTVSVSPTAGTNMYVFTAISGVCSASDTVFVNISGNVAANAGPDGIIIGGSNYVLGGAPTGPAGSTFTWTPSATLNDSTVANPVSTPTVTTTYTVTVNDNGCIATDDITITVIDPLLVVNSFTPNDDGVNDTWIIDLFNDYPEGTVEIYNRWGQMLHRTQGNAAPWDGQYNGGDLPMGSYIYVIDLKVSGIPALTGTVTILR